MKVLAIDPGTNCGWCVMGFIIDTPVISASGVWSLECDKCEGAGMRFVKMTRYLKEVIATFRPGMVAFEDVRGHKGTSAAHIYGGIVACIQQVCEELKIPYVGIPVGTIKKRATGKGNCGKEEMITASRAVLGRDPVDDNEADAVYCALVALEKYA